MDDSVAPSPSTVIMRTPFTVNSAFDGSKFSVHHTAEYEPSKSNVRCSTTCSVPSVSICAWMSTSGMI